MNKRGFTLIELMVYMAIVGIVVIIAGQAFGDSTKIGMNSKNMIAANQVAEDVGVLLRDDIAQMGVKSYLGTSESGAFDDKFDIHPKVFIDDKNGEEDKSSFNYTHNQGGTDLDKITLRRIRNNENGTFLRVEEIEWFVNNKKQLIRTCRTIDGTQDADVCPNSAASSVELASGVNKFVLTPSKPASNVGEAVIFPLAANQGKFVLIPRSDPSKGIATVSRDPLNAATSVTLSGFVSNYDASGNPSAVSVYHQVFVSSAGTHSQTWNNATKFSFVKGTTYELRFMIPYREDASRMFRPGKDHMSVGFKQIADGGVVNCPAISETFIFPPETEDGVATHVIQFTPRENVQNALLAFTFAFYSPTVSSGAITISDLELKSVTDGEYIFVKDYVPSTANKVNVRAFKMELQVVKNGVTGKSETVIPVPSNGAVEQ